MVPKGFVGKDPFQLLQNELTEQLIGHGLGSQHIMIDPRLTTFLNPAFCSIYSYYTPRRRENGSLRWTDARAPKAECLAPLGSTWDPRNLLVVLAFVPVSFVLGAPSPTAVN